MKCSFIAKEWGHFSQILRYKKYNTSSEVFCSAQITGTHRNTSKHSWTNSILCSFLAGLLLKDRLVFNCRVAQPPHRT